MSKRMSKLAFIPIILWGVFNAPAAHIARGQSYVEPVSLYRVRWGGGVYGGSVVLTADPSQANVLGKLDGAEVGVLGMVFDRQMPNTTPLYRLSKPLAGRDSPERYYTTSKAKVDDLVKNEGWTSEGILAYVSRGLDGGTNRFITCQSWVRSSTPRILDRCLKSICEFTRNNTEVLNSTFNGGVRHEV